MTRQDGIKVINPYFWLSGLQESQKYGIRCSSERPIRGGRQPRGCSLANRQAVTPDDENGADPEKGISLNFKVSPEFKKEFKGFAVAQGISMTDLLKEGFTLSKKKRQK